MIFSRPESTQKKHLSGSNLKKLPRVNHSSSAGAFITKKEFDNMETSL